MCMCVREAPSLLDSWNQLAEIIPTGKHRKKIHVPHWKEIKDSLTQEKIQPSPQIPSTLLM